MGLSPLQKVVCAVRQRCYGMSSDAFDEYVRIGESTGVESLKEFCRCIVESLEKNYLCEQTAEDIERIKRKFSAAGFTGCLGCLDYAGRI